MSENPKKERLEDALLEYIERHAIAAVGNCGNNSDRGNGTC